MTGFLGLIAAEVRRALSRRLFRVMAALTVLGVLVAAGVVFFQSSNDPNSGLAEAQREVDSCERDRARTGGRFPDGERFTCPTVEEMRQAFDRRFRYAETIPDASRGVAMVLTALSLVIGASFVGAEWGTGSMATLLTWEPRRGRVLVGKTLACVALVAAGVAVLLAIMAVVFLPAAWLRGTTQGMSGSMWWTLLGIWARGAGLAAFAGALGAGLATLTGNTAGSVGIGLAYGLIVDPLLSAWREGRYGAWMLRHLLPRLLGLPVQLPRSSGGSVGDFGFVEPRVLSPMRPIVLLSIYAVALIAVAYASFRARDVT